MIAALYIDRKGPYPSIAGVDCWPLDRDARLYAGPHLCIAHPPCGHWGRYYQKCLQPGKDCGMIAVRQVRQFGGVLEHPADSGLWASGLLPPPGGGYDLWGGYSIKINQADFGHAALKPTFLYFHGIPRLPAMPPAATLPLRPLEHLSATQRHLTPPRLAAWLVAALANDF